METHHISSASEETKDGLLVYQTATLIGTYNGGRERKYQAWVGRIIYLKLQGNPFPV